MNTAIAQPAPRDLIPVFQADIGGILTNACDARLLHSFLEVGKDFSNWIKDRIKQYGFQENQDYISTLAKIGELDGRGLQGRIEYTLTLDMGKEISMVEKNTQGRQARKYFINCERLAIESLISKSQTQHDLTHLPEPPTITRAQQGELFTLVANKARSSGKPNAYFWSRYNNHFKLSSYKLTPADKFDEAMDYLRRLEGEEADQFMMLTPLELSAIIQESMKSFKPVEGEVMPKPEAQQQCLTINLSPLPGKKHKRWLITQACDEMVIMMALDEDKEIMTRDELIRDLQLDDYIVVKKTDVVSKLQA